MGTAPFATRSIHGHSGDGGASLRNGAGVGVNLFSRRTSTLFQTEEKRNGMDVEA